MHVLQVPGVQSNAEMKDEQVMDIFLVVHVVDAEAKAAVQDAIEAFTLQVAKMDGVVKVY